MKNPPYEEHPWLTSLYKKLEKLNKKYDNDVVALAVLAEVYGYPKSPRVCLWDGDSADVQANKLYTLLTTPHGRTENQLPGMEKLVDEMHHELASNGASSAGVGAITSMLYEKSVGKLGQTGRYYADEAPGKSEETKELMADLEKQFGAFCLKEIFEKDERLPEIIYQRLLAADIRLKRYYDLIDRLGPSDED